LEWGVNCCVETDITVLIPRKSKSGIITKSPLEKEKRGLGKVRKTLRYDQKAETHPNSAQKKKGTENSARQKSQKMRRGTKKQK